MNLLNKHYVIFQSQLQVLYVLAIIKVRKVAVHVLLMTALLKRNEIELALIRGNFVSNILIRKPKPRFLEDFSREGFYKEYWV